MGDALTALLEALTRATDTINAIEGEGEYSTERKESNEKAGEAAGE